MVQISQQYLSFQKVILVSHQIVMHHTEDHFSQPSFLNWYHWFIIHHFLKASIRNNVQWHESTAQTVGQNVVVICLREEQSCLAEFVNGGENAYKSWSGRRSLNNPRLKYTHLKTQKPHSFSAGCSGITEIWTYKRGWPMKNNHLRLWKQERWNERVITDKQIFSCK